MADYSNVGNAILLVITIFVFISFTIGLGNGNEVEDIFILTPG
ncbi:hypothetical protein [Alteribacter populi]|nr:hypothetical protein [Alteribacter populi]